MEHLLFLLAEAEINGASAIDESRFNLLHDLHVAKNAEKPAEVDEADEDVTVA